MKFELYLYVLLVVFGGAVVNASSPPAAVLHCVNDIARLCEGFHSNYECICYNRDRMLYCLATVSPYGNYMEARDHFLGTCIDRIPALINDPNFNLDLPRKTSTTTVGGTLTSASEFPSSALEPSNGTKTPLPTLEPTASATEPSVSEGYPSTSVHTSEHTTTSTDLSSEYHSTVSTEPLPIPLPTDIPVHIPPDECDDNFEDDPEEDYDDNCECECQCDCGDDDDDNDDDNDGDDEDDEEEDYDENDNFDGIEEKEEEEEEGDYDDNDDTNEDEEEETEDCPDEDNDDDHAEEDDGDGEGEDDEDDTEDNEEENQEDEEDNDECYCYCECECNDEVDDSEKKKDTRRGELNSEEHEEYVDDNYWTCDTSNPEDCLDEDDAQVAEYFSIKKAFLSLPKQYQYGSPENRFWEEEKKSRAEILNEIKRKYGKKNGKNLDAESEEEESESDHPNAIDFIFATPEKIFKRDVEKEEESDILSSGLNSLNPKKLLFEEGEDRRIRFGSSFLKTGKLPKKKLQDDCD